MYDPLYYNLDVALHSPDVIRPYRINVRNQDT